MKRRSSDCSTIAQPPKRFFASLTPPNQRDWDSTPLSPAQVHAEKPKSTQPVPIIDARSPDAGTLYREAVQSGCPIVLTGPRMQNLTEFSQGWFSSGKFDRDEFAASCGTAEAPVCRTGYRGSQLESGETMPVKLFVNLHWPESKSVYLAQWQFATHIIEEQDEMNDAWRLSSLPQDVVGVDFLSLGEHRFNPYQYIFMGGSGTQSKIHNDLGGFSIFVTCVVGCKHLVLVHRDDEALVYGMTRNVEELDADAQPLSALARVWAHTLVPGDVLVMPPRTIHQVVNPTPCLSYSRCHLGPAEMAEWLRSHDVGDAPQMRHAETVYAAGYSLLGQAERPPHVVEALRCLRDATAVLAGRLVEEDGALSWLRIYEDLAAGAGLDQTMPKLVEPNPQHQGGPAPGDIVALAPHVASGPRASRKAHVVKLTSASAFALVRFKGQYASYAPELIPLSRIRPVGARNGAAVKVLWAVSNEEFEATLVDVFQSIDAAQVQFMDLGQEWNQWVEMDSIRALSKGLKVTLL